MSLRPIFLPQATETSRQVLPVNAILKRTTPRVKVIKRMKLFRLPNQRQHPLDPFKPKFTKARGEAQMRAAQKK